MARLAPATDLDDDDDDLDDGYDDEDEGEDPADTPEEWQAWVPDIIKTIEKGWLDEYLKPIALAARWQYMRLHPDEFPDEPPPPSPGGINIAGTTRTPRQQTARQSSSSASTTSGDVNMAIPDARPILGDTDVLPVRAGGVGEEGRMPVGSFRHHGDAYSKAALKGRRFVSGPYPVKQGRSTVGRLPAGVVYRVVEVGDKRFMAVIDPTTPQPSDAPAALMAQLSGVAMPFLFEYNHRLFEGTARNRVTNNPGGRITRKRSR